MVNSGEGRGEGIYAVVAIGSNLGERVVNMRRAIELCGDFMRVCEVSRFYRTEPMYISEQPEFLNGAFSGYVDLPVAEFLMSLKGIESVMGRKAVERYGPRLIDLDIIFFGDAVIDMGADLVVPHPLMHERDFVLSPLVDICCNFVHPVLGLSVRELYERIDSTAQVYGSGD